MLIVLISLFWLCIELIVCFMMMLVIVFKFGVCGCVVVGGWLLWVCCLRIVALWFAVGWYLYLIGLWFGLGCCYVCLLIVCYLGYLCWVC